jgi:hypothetical protein
VELSVDYRANHPIHLAIGPVLHPDDAVGNKVLALWGRQEPRDFIDVDAALRAGYAPERLLGLAAQRDQGFNRRSFADCLSRAASLPDADFAEYGLHGRDLDELRGRFADWRAELLAA